MKPRIAAIVLALAAGACEAERPGVTVPDRDAAPVEDAGQVTFDSGAASGAVHADGTWLLFIQDRYCLYAAGSVTDFIVWSWYRVEMTHAGPGPEDDQLWFRQRVKLCAQDQSPVTAGLITYVPAEVTQALPERDLAGYLLGDRPGDRYVSEELVENWGLSDEVAPEDPLPESAESDRIIDQDGDGEPGVTMVLGNDFCRIQLAQRTRYRLGGEVASAVRIEGTLWSEVDKTILGASLPLCEAENQLDARPDGNRMVLVRIDGQGGAPDLDADADGEVSCAEVMSAREPLLEADTVIKDTPDSSRCR